MAGSTLKLQLEWRKDLVLTYICLDGLSFFWEVSLPSSVENKGIISPFWGISAWISSLALFLFISLWFLFYNNFVCGPVMCVGLWWGFSYSVLLASPVSLGKPVINADSLAPNQNLWEVGSKHRYLFFFKVLWVILECSRVGTLCIDVEK